MRTIPKMYGDKGWRDLISDCMGDCGSRKLMYRSQK